MFLALEVSQVLINLSVSPSKKITQLLRTASGVFYQLDGMIMSFVTSVKKVIILIFINELVPLKLQKMKVVCSTPVIEITASGVTTLMDTGCSNLESASKLNLLTTLSSLWILI